METALDFEACRNHDWYFPLVKEDERHGLDGEVNNMFFMADSYHLAIITSGDDEKADTIFKSIPGCEKWKRLIIV